MSLINRKQTKEFVLEEAKLQGRIQFERVGKSFLDRINKRMEQVIRHEIQTHPSRGVTLK